MLLIQILTSIVQIQTKSSSQIELNSEFIVLLLMMKILMRALRSMFVVLLKNERGV